MPDSEGDSFRLGMTAYKEKRYDEAVSHFLEVIHEQSVIHKSFNALGVTYSRMGKRKEAEGYFTKALTLDPDNQIYQKNLKSLSQDSQSIVQKNQKKESKRAFREKNFRIMIGVTLVAVIGIFLISLQAGFFPQVWMTPFINGTHQGGLFTSWLDTSQEVRILPVPDLKVENKRVEFSFDRDQDLMKIERIQTVLSTTKDAEDHQITLPIISRPQHGIYYVIDDPYFGKQKHIIMTVFYEDGISGVIADQNLPPR